MTDQEPEDGVETSAETPAPPKRSHRKHVPKPEPEPVAEAQPPEISDPLTTEITGVQVGVVWDDDDFQVEFDDEEPTSDAEIPLGTAIAISFGVETLAEAMVDIRRRKKSRGITPVLRRQIRKGAAIAQDALQENERTDFLEENGRSLGRLVILLDAPIPKKTAAQKALASLIRSARRDLRADIRMWQSQVETPPTDDLSALLD